MPFPPNAHMPILPNNPRAPPHAAGRDIQPQADPPTGDTNEHNQPKKRANICIASLNVNGASAPTQNMNHIDKWSIINSTLRKERIAVLALQETHLDDERIADINRCFRKSFDIINSSTPGNARTTAGVAILLNKALIAPTSVQTYILQQGRAMMTKIKWSGTEELTILNVYAPNERGQHPAFWAQIETERRRKRLPKPDIVLGNFNVT
jgi:exonuclease III